MIMTISPATENVPSSGSLAWLEKEFLKWSMAVGVVSSNIILLYFLLVGCCVFNVDRERWRSYVC